MLSSNEDDKSGIEITFKNEENCQCEPNIKKLKLEKTLDIKDNSSDSNPYIDVKKESLEIDATSGDSSEVPKLSKRQLKKLKKKEKWLERLPAKSINCKSYVKISNSRAKEKERLKQRKLEARLNKQPLGPSRKLLKNSKMSESKCKVRVAIDTSFDDLMNNKDTNKCVNQLLRCYSANRRASNPIQLYFTSFVGNTKTEMAKLSGYTNWDVCSTLAVDKTNDDREIGVRIPVRCTKVAYVSAQYLNMFRANLTLQVEMFTIVLVFVQVNFKSESYMDIFDKNELIYLSSDSDNIITTLEDDKVYIIGGLVDHNSQKGLTLQIANDKGIAHAQLPIREYLEMRTTKVLSIVHVFEILLAVTEGSPWKEALLNVLPSRKGATEKYESSASDSETEGAENMFEVEGTIETATNSNKCIEAADST
uniref:tRNA (guanine(9)-N(1))-methyltransferase n=1 Tax=Timema douglasi TaxID=61478 RepID=A0A7R8VG52_TIMDO|nr:unnamed protein product [Timema douglasi]